MKGAHTIRGNKILGDALEEAFGIKNVRWFRFEAGVDRITTLNVEFFPEVDGVKALVPVLKRFELVPKPDEPQGDAA